MFKYKLTGTHCGCPFALSAVLVLILVLVLVLIGAAVGILVAILVAILVVVLVVVLSLVVLAVHSKILRFYICGNAASIAFPEYQDLSFGLNIRLVRRPATIAAVMPPAAAFSPPVRIPRKPC